MQNEVPNRSQLDRTDLERLIQSGLIDSAHRESALASFRNEVGWKGWIGFWSGALGAIFLLAGVLFFFAANWKEMSPLLRFGVLEVFLAITIVGACLTGIRTSIGQWALSAASVFTGILIAVYGQVYQTGADAFEVFALWSGLMLAWVVIAKFAPLWVFWLVILETALCLYGGQILVPDGNFSWASVFIGLGLVTMASLYLWERLHLRESFSWLSGEWIRVALVAASVYWLTMTPWLWIFGFGYRSEVGPLALFGGTILWIAAISFAVWFYQTKRPSLISLSLGILSAAVILICWLAKLILDLGSDGAFEFLFVGLLGVLIFSAAAAGIIRAGRRIQTASTEKD